jgi:hypothetical protein
MAPPSLQDLSWELVVQDPVTALECYQCEFGQSLADVATSFLQTGRLFNTCIQSNEVHEVPVCPHYLQWSIGLGWQAAGYRGDIKYYAAYGSLQTALLAHPHLHMALLKGGIIWCLALHIIEPSHVIAGPLDDVFKDRNFFIDSDGTQLWDDLLEDELGWRSQCKVLVTCLWRLVPAVTWKYSQWHCFIANGNRLEEVIEVLEANGTTHQ